MRVADQVALDPFRQHVADTRVGRIRGHLDRVERALFLGDGKALHQRAGVARHRAAVARRRYHE